MKINPLIRVAICMSKEQQQLLPLFYNQQYFEVSCNTSSGAQLIKHLSTDPNLPQHIFMSSSIALQQEETLARLFHEFPGLKLIGLLGSDTTLSRLKLARNRNIKSKSKPRSKASIENSSNSKQNLNWYSIFCKPCAIC